MRIKEFNIETYLEVCEERRKRGLPTDSVCEILAKNCLNPKLDYEFCYENLLRHIRNNNLFKS